MALSARIKPKVAGCGFSIKLQSTDTPDNAEEDDNNDMSSQPLISRRSADHAKMV